MQSFRGIIGRVLHRPYHLLDDGSIYRRCRNIDMASTGPKGPGGECLYSGPLSCLFRAQLRSLCESRLRGQIRREELVHRYWASWGLRKPDKAFGPCPFWLLRQRQASSGRLCLCNCWYVSTSQNTCLASAAWTKFLRLRSLERARAVWTSLWIFEPLQ